MVFSSYLFLFLFLPVFFGMYFCTPSRFRNTTALLGSYFFYAWGAPGIIPLLLLSTVMDFVLGRFLNPKSQISFRGRNRLLTLGIALNLIFLLYFKYSNFFVEEFNHLLQLCGLAPFSWAQVALPIGVSFFTFQKISYLVDVYRGTAPPATNFINYALYVALFPQLIAGPIIRYHDLAEQLVKRTATVDLFFSGVIRFCSGLSKKVLLADALGRVADNVFALPNTELLLPYAWLGILCYAFQIYFDFSGYSDMAIGLGRMMGFRFLENFNMPYSSENFSEFWRRWHISLSNWMKEYLYIPLGGNRGARRKTYLNLWTVFLLSGLWHGASWNFLVWGAFHGFFLALDKAYWLEASRRFPRFLKIALTFFLVIIGWVFFRAENLSQALTYLHAMFDLSSYFSSTNMLMRGEIIHTRAFFTLFVATILCFAPAHRGLRERIEHSSIDTLSSPLSNPCAVMALSGFLLSLLALATAGYTPFLYFRF